MNLTENEKQTLKRLFMRGVSVLGVPETITAENVGEILKAGLDQESNFIDEMIACRTDRAKKARDVLTARVYVEVQDRGLSEKLLQHYENEAQRIGFYKARDAVERGK